MAVVAEVFLMAPRAGFPVAGDFLLMARHPLRGENARLPNSQGLMAHSAGIRRFLAVMAFEAGIHPGRVLCRRIPAVDNPVMADCAPDASVPVLLVSDLQAMVDDQVPGFGMALLAAFIGNVALDRAGVHSALHMLIDLAHGGQLALHHIAHPGHDMALFALDVLMR